jgi:rubrerythrin
MKGIVICLALAVSLSTAGFTAQQVTAMNKGNLKNLMDSYKRAMTAREHFLVFAEKADQEGYKKAGQLFRAAVNSEIMQIGTLERAIIEMGGKPDMLPGNPRARTTKENLAWAVKNASEEADSMYPKYLEDAKSDNIKSVVFAFYRGARVQANSKMLFQDALNNLDSWKLAAAKGFYVCQVCGKIAPMTNFEICPVCKAPVSEFKQIP